MMKSSEDGEWVQQYTRRGSPMRGKYRWRTKSAKRQEMLFAVLICIAMGLSVIAPIIFGG
jgi:hypothetical protein